MHYQIEYQTTLNHDNESLLAAASAGAVDTLALLLNERGANINTVDQSRQTALTHAILAGCEEGAMFLRANVKSGGCGI